MLVIKQRVNGFLQHTFFIADNNFRCMHFHKPFQTIVTNNHTAIQIVQIRCRNMARIQCNKRTHIWWNNRYNIRQHPLRFGFRIQERLYQFQLLHNRFAFGFGFRFRQFRTQTCPFIAHIKVCDNTAYTFGANTNAERVRAVFFDRSTIFIFTNHIILLKVRKPRFNNNIRIIGYNLFQLFLRQIVQQCCDFTFTQEPSMRNRHRQFDMSHTFTTYGCRPNLYPATFADNTAELDSFILSASAFIIFDGSENLLTEQSVRFRFQ